MKILNISLDRSLFSEGSKSEIRLAKQASLVEEMHVVVYFSFHVFSEVPSFRQSFINQCPLLRNRQTILVTKFSFLSKPSFQCICFE